MLGTNEDGHSSIHIALDRAIALSKLYNKNRLRREKGDKRHSVQQATLIPDALLPDSSSQRTVPDSSNKEQGITKLVTDQHTVQAITDPGQSKKADASHNEASGQAEMHDLTRPVQMQSSGSLMDTQVSSDEDFDSQPATQRRAPKFDLLPSSEQLDARVVEAPKAAAQKGKKLKSESKGSESGKKPKSERKLKGRCSKLARPKQKPKPQTRLAGKPTVAEPKHQIEDSVDVIAPKPVTADDHVQHKPTSKPGAEQDSPLELTVATGNPAKGSCKQNSKAKFPRLAACPDINHVWRMWSDGDPEQKILPVSRCLIKEQRDSTYDAKLFSQWKTASRFIKQFAAQERISEAASNQILEANRQNLSCSVHKYFLFNPQGRLELKATSKTPCQSQADQDVQQQPLPEQPLQEHNASKDLQEGCPEPDNSEPAPAAQSPATEQCSQLDEALLRRLDAMQLQIDRALEEKLQNSNVRAAQQEEIAELRNAIARMESKCKGWSNSLEEVNKTVDELSKRAEEFNGVQAKVDQLVILATESLQKVSLEDLQDRDRQITSLAQQIHILKGKDAFWVERLEALRDRDTTAQALESKFDDLKTRLEDKSESMMKEVERLDRDQGKIGLLLEQLQHQLNVEQCALSTKVQDIDKTLEANQLKLEDYRCNQQTRSDNIMMAIMDERKTSRAELEEARNYARTVGDASTALLSKHTDDIEAMKKASDSLRDRLAESSEKTSRLVEKFDKVDDLAKKIDFLSQLQMTRSQELNPLHQQVNWCSREIAELRREIAEVKHRPQALPMLPAGNYAAPVTPLSSQTDIQLYTGPDPAPLPMHEPQPSQAKDTSVDNTSGAQETASKFSPVQVPTPEQPESSRPASSPAAAAEQHQDPANLPSNLPNLPASTAGEAKTPPANAPNEQRPCTDLVLVPETTQEAPNGGLSSAQALQKPQPVQKQQTARSLDSTVSAQQGSRVSSRIAARQAAAADTQKSTDSQGIAQGNPVPPINASKAAVLPIRPPAVQLNFAKVVPSHGPFGMHAAIPQSAAPLSQRMVKQEPHNSPGRQKILKPIAQAPKRKRNNPATSTAAGKPAKMQKVSGAAKAKTGGQAVVQPSRPQDPQSALVVPGKTSVLQPGRVTPNMAILPQSRSFVHVPNLGTLTSVSEFWRIWNVGCPQNGGNPVRMLGDQVLSEPLKTAFTVWRAAAFCIRDKALIERTTPEECAEQLEAERQELACALVFFVKDVLPALHVSMQPRDKP